MICIKNVSQKKKYDMLKIFLLTKNEEALIEDWIRYHGFLFGFENLHIIDGSDNRKVLDIYEKYRQKGLNVYFSKANLNEITDVLNEYMHKYKGEDNFLIKLDTDEFLAYTSPFTSKPRRLGRLFWQKYLGRKAGGYITKKYMNFLYGNKQLKNDEFKEIFKNLPITGQRYGVSFTAFSIPTNNDVQRPCCEITSFTPIQFTFSKSFFHSQSFCSIDLGGHWGKTTNNKGVINTGLTVIHYHAISTRDSLRKTRQVLISHKYIEERDSLDQCKEKLLKIKKSGIRSSYHKVNLYLAYIYSIKNNTFFLPKMLNKYMPYCYPTKRIRKISLVRDILVKIDSLSSFG